MAETHRAAIVIEWEPSASIGEPRAVRRLLESKAAVIVDVLADWGVTEARGRVDDEFADDTLCDCGDRLSAKCGARCGNCQAASEPMPLAVAKFDHRSSGEVVPDAEHVMLRVDEGQHRLHIDGEYAVYRRTDRPTQP